MTDRVQLSGIMTGQIDNDRGLIVRVVASRAVGRVTDANSQEFNLTPEVLRGIVDNYNRRVHLEHDATIIQQKRIPIGKKLIEKITGKTREQFELSDIALLPVQLEHELHVMQTIGTVMGLMEMGRWDGAECIFADLLISDDDAIKRIHDGRLHQVSISFSWPDLEADEISFTVYGAVDQSSIVAIKDGTRMEYSKTKVEKELPLLTNSTPTFLFGDEVKRIQLRIQDIESEKRNIKLRKQQLLFKQENKTIALSLVKNGKVYAKFKDFIADDFSKFSSSRDRDIALRIFSTMPSVIRSPKNQNMLAFKTEELLMDSKLSETVKSFKKEIKSFYTQAEINAQRKIDLKRKGKLSTPEEGKEDIDDEGNTKSAELSTDIIKEGHELSLDSMEKHIHGPDHEAEFKSRMANHAKMGNHKEGFEEYCKFYGMDMSESAVVDIRPNEINQVPMSDTKTDEDKETKEELETLEKKEADLSEEGDSLIKDLAALVKKWEK